MIRRDAGGLAGAARLVLLPGVVALDAERALFDAMLEGWARQQRSRLLNESTVATRRRLVRRFAVFTGEYPWQWRPQDLEDFTTSLRGGGTGRTHSTLRGYQGALRSSATSSPIPAMAGRRSARLVSARTRCRSATSGTPRCTQSSSRAARAGEP